MEASRKRYVSSSYEQRSITTCLRTSRMKQVQRREKSGSSDVANFFLGPANKCDHQLPNQLFPHIKDCGAYLAKVLIIQHSRVQYCTSFKVSRKRYVSCSYEQCSIMTCLRTFHDEVGIGQREKWLMLSGWPLFRTKQMMPRPSLKVVTYKHTRSRVSHLVKGT